MGFSRLNQHNSTQGFVNTQDILSRKIAKNQTLEHPVKACNQTIDIQDKNQLMSSSFDNSYKGKEYGFIWVIVQNKHMVKQMSNPQMQKLREKYKKVLDQRRRTLNQTQTCDRIKIKLNKS